MSPAIHPPSPEALVEGDTLVAKTIAAATARLGRAPTPAEFDRWADVYEVVAAGFRAAAVENLAQAVEPAVVPPVKPRRSATPKPASKTPRQVPIKHVAPLREPAPAQPRSATAIALEKHGPPLAKLPLRPPGKTPPRTP